MPTNPTNDQRLRRLNAAQPQRPWATISEKRHCLVCENDFSGRDVVIRRGGAVACPHCGSGPKFWVRSGNPLTDALVWADWEVAIAMAQEQEDESELQSVG